MCLLAIKQVGSGRWDVVVENNTVVEFDEVGFPPVHVWKAKQSGIRLTIPTVAQVPQ